MYGSSSASLPTMKACFCGCGRSVPFGRRRATNAYGGRIAEDVAMLQGAQQRAPGLAAGEDVPRLIADGLAFRTTLARVVHGEASRETIDKVALKVWWKQMQPHRERMMQAGSELEGSVFGGRNAEIALTGVRAEAVLVRVEDTGTTVNDMPRVRLVFEARPAAGPPVEIAIVRNVSRLSIPRPGITLPIAYDADDPQDRHTFDDADLDAALAADPAAATTAAVDPVEQLAKLHALHVAGGLTDAEFAAAKQRVLYGA